MLEVAEIDVWLLLMCHRIIQILEIIYRVVIKNSSNMIDTLQKHQLTKEQEVKATTNRIRSVLIIHSRCTLISIIKLTMEERILLIISFKREKLMMKMRKKNRLNHSYSNSSILPSNNIQLLFLMNKEKNQSKSNLLILSRSKLM